MQERLNDSCGYRVFGCIIHTKMEKPRENHIRADIHTDHNHVVLTKKMSKRQGMKDIMFLHSMS